MAVQDPFVHLHNHTEFSLLDGANRIKDMVGHAKGMGMDALAITDHGVMFGAMTFYRSCVQAGIKPIIGMEAYVAPLGVDKKETAEERENCHLLLLAASNEGYKNLCKLHSMAALQHFYRKPRIDRDLLKDHAKGLIGTSACLASDICQAIMKHGIDRARDLAAEYREIFDEGHFFIELQDHAGLQRGALPDSDIEVDVNEHLIRLARELKLPLVATNDAHYLRREDASAHEVLLCIGTNTMLKERQTKKTLGFEVDEFYLKTHEEMVEIFGNIPEALENTRRIAEMCNVTLEKSTSVLPEADLPAGKDAATYLKELSEAGLERRGMHASPEAQERLKFELEVIGQTGFDSYFLIVKECTDYAREEKIAFGVRGSGAGSLVLYCLGITDVDPIHYDLTFERFLNPARISMPDIDIDIEDARRDDIVKFVSEKYGKENTAQIITFGTLGAKNAIRDTCRVMGLTPGDADRICKTIPGDLKITIENAIKNSADLRKLLDQEPRYKQAVETAKRIEGISRNPGVHAAGVVVSKEPLYNYIPLYKGQDNQAITGFDMASLDALGMLKLDFLGLSNLTVVTRAIELIKDSVGAVGLFATSDDIAEQHPVINGTQAIPLDDEKTFDMLSKAETVGVFQLESAGMRRYISQVEPRSVLELAAMVALYRPGPMEHITTYARRKHGKEPIRYIHERVEKILEETYGVIVFQDQVLKIVQALAGFSLGEADILRKAISKKDSEILNQSKDEFVQKCENNQIERSTAERIWRELEPFAGYAFNKAHSVCYALLAYYTAYLKANYTTEYMAALLSAYSDKEDRLIIFLAECRKMGVQVLPPDVNRSHADFIIETVGNKRAIRFGMTAIKQVGNSIIRAIIEERNVVDQPSEGEVATPATDVEPGHPPSPYTHLFEFAERLKPRGLTRSALESLIKAGAFDQVGRSPGEALERHRSALVESAGAAMIHADRATRMNAAQDSLFEDDPELNTKSFSVLQADDPWTRFEMLHKEKEAVGIFVTEHPCAEYTKAISVLASHSTDQIPELKAGQTVTLAGVITSRQLRQGSSGTYFCIVTLEDLHGSCSMFANSKILERFGDLLSEDMRVVVRGKVRHRTLRSDEVVSEINIDHMEDLTVAGKPYLPEGEDDIPYLVVELDQATEVEVQALYSLLVEHPGAADVFFKIGVGEQHKTVSIPLSVSADSKLVAAIQNLSPANWKAEVVDASGVVAQEEKSAHYVS